MARNLNEIIADLDKENLNRREESNSKYMAELYEAIQEEAGVNEKQAKILYDRAYDEGHPSGRYEVLYYLETLIDMIIDLKNAETA